MIETLRTYLCINLLSALLIGTRRHAIHVCMYVQLAYIASFPAAAKVKQRGMSIIFQNPPEYVFEYRLSASPSDVAYPSIYFILEYSQTKKARQTVSGNTVPATILQNRYDTCARFQRSAGESAECN